MGFSSARFDYRRLFSDKAIFCVSLPMFSRARWSAQIPQNGLFQGVFRSQLQMTCQHLSLELVWLESTKATNKGASWTNQYRIYVFVYTKQQSVLTCSHEIRHVMSWRRQSGTPWGDGSRPAHLNGAAVHLERIWLSFQSIPKSFQN